MAPKKSFIQFCPAAPKPKTKVWHARVNDDTMPFFLGEIKWFGKWRRYAFSPSTYSETVFDAHCLRIMADFCELQTKQHRSQHLAAQSS